MSEKGEGASPPKAGYLGAREENTMLLALLAACTPTESNINQLYPSLVVSPGEVDFGEVVVDYKVSAVVEIINGGRVELDLNEISFTNDFGGVYTLMALEEIEEQDTGVEAMEIPLELPITLAGDERLQLSVSFLPGTYQDYRTALSFSHNDPDQADFELPVTGIGSDGPTPDIELDTQTLDFDVVTPGQPAVKWVTITNIGDGPLTIWDCSARCWHARAAKAASPSRRPSTPLRRRTPKTPKGTARTPWWTRTPRLLRLVSSRKRSRTTTRTRRPSPSWKAGPVGSLMWPMTLTTSRSRCPMPVSYTHLTLPTNREV